MENYDPGYAFDLCSPLPYEVIDGGSRIRLWYPHHGQTLLATINV
jgi:hypothetical protein